MTVRMGIVDLESSYRDNGASRSPGIARTGEYVAHEETMPKREHYNAGVPSWVDLGTTDVDAAKRFYSSLFGWEWTGNEMLESGGTYWMASLQDEPVAGVVGFPPDVPMGSVWNTYVNVDSVDETLGKASPAGGEIAMPASDAGEAGRFAFFKDPAGAVLGLWQSGRHRGAGLVNEPGTFIWCEVYADDAGTIAEFYARVFGWTSKTDTMPEGLEYTMFKLGEDPVAGTAPQPPGVPPHWHVWFGADNVEAIVAKTEELGGTVDLGATQGSFGNFAFLRDPAGAAFSVIKGA